ncbi:MAG: hypothetical protein ACI8P9_000158 [Parasphingorhabdus sp.]|jgi:hypothetical protein
MNPNKQTLSVLALCVGLMYGVGAQASICGITTVGGGSSSANFGVDADVSGSGGATIGSANYSLSGSLGQPTQNIDSTSASYGGATGFWNVLSGEEGEPQFRDLQCEGTVAIASLADFDAYVASDFGSAGGDKYKNLLVIASLSESSIGLLSPCKIELTAGVNLSATSISVEGGKGVHAKEYVSFDAGEICIASDKDKVKLDKGSNVNADNLNIASRKEVKIGNNFNAQLTSSGVVSSSDGKVIFEKEAQMNLLSLSISGAKGVDIKSDVYIEAIGSITMLTESQDQNHGHKHKQKFKLDIGKNSTLIADVVDLVSGQIKVGDNTVITTQNGLKMMSTGEGKDSKLEIKKSVSLTSFSDIDLISADGLSIGQNADLLVTGNLNVDAAGSGKKSCHIDKSVTASYLTSSGSCASDLP